jgi:YHS domain-containing protein
VNPEAYEAYLRGRFYLTNQSTMVRSYPICNMEVDEQIAEFKSQYGAKHIFCSAKNNLNLGPNSMHVSPKKTV